MTKDLEVIKGNFSSILASVDLLILNKAILKNCQGAVHAIAKTHHKKLENVTKNELLPFRKNEAITNFSNYRVSDNETSLLKNGVFIANLIKTVIFVSFENLCNFLTSNMKDKEEKGEIVSQISHLAN